MTMELSAGLRVVRGPDWSYDDQDGGEGHVGTVAEVEGASSVIVQWDYGKRCRYHCGTADKYELRVLDAAPTGLTHPLTACTWCDQQPIRGMVWKCVSCYDYQLCSLCYHAGKHSVEHEFERIESRDFKRRTRVGRRYMLGRVVSRGMWPGATVERGWDWQWGDQDGGKGHQGTVVAIEDWGDETARSVVKIEWNNTRGKNIYRLAHRGKTDLKCTVAGTGMFYYPSHLPILGLPFKWPPPNEISAGDAVRVELDPDLFKIAQEEHGGWNDRMAEFIGRVGVVGTILDEGDIVIRYSNNKVFLLNPGTLTKVDVPVFDYGDVVRVLDDMVQVSALQTNHGDWNGDMALALGQVGRVVKMRVDSDVKVAVNGRRWVMNPLCLRHAPGEVPREDDREKLLDADVALRIHLLSLAQADCPDVVGLAAAAGDVTTLRDYLHKNPHEINTKVQGKTPLHIAVIERHLPVLEVLLQHNPNLTMEDESGETPLHLCAYVNNGQAAQMLLEAGADVNAKDLDGASAIAVSAALGHYSVLEVLLGHPNVDVNSQDSSGKTALHSAVFSQRRRAVRVLLEHGADPTLCDYALRTSMYNAAGFGFTAGMEELLRYCPNYVNIQKDDGYTALHVATANNHCSVASLIASHPSCNLNAKDDVHLTPLHIAVHEGHVKVVERLVGYGADVNIITRDGNTPLHMVLRKQNMADPTKDTPMLFQIQDELERIHGKRTLTTNVIVGVFLVQQGADLHIKNQNGISPLQILPADISSLILSYRGKSDSFCGSLRTLICPFDEPPKVRPLAMGRVRFKATVSSGPASGLPVGHHRAAAVSSGPASGLPVGRHRSSPETVFKTEDKDKKHYNKASSRDTVVLKEKDYPKEKVNLQNNQGPEGAFKTLAKELLPCFLCERPADIKFLPCADIVMCHDCVYRVKKCPQCRNTVEKFIPVCVFCKSPHVTYTQIPCNHTYCKDCRSGQDHCSACQSIAETELT